MNLNRLRSPHFLFLWLCLVFSAIGSFAQQSWLKAGQVYLKMPVVESGIYRIYSDDLKRAGWELGKIDPRTVQVFHRGREVAIGLNDQTDGRFDPADFIELYATRNNGAADSALYRPTNAQPHQRYSLYSDTTYYYLTYQTNGQFSKRMAVVGAASAPVPQATEPYHLERQLTLFTDDYSFNSRTGPVPFLKYSHFEKGEGWTGKMRNKNVAGLWNVKLDNWVKNAAPLPQLSFLLQGRDQSPHQVVWRIGNDGAPQEVAFRDFDPELVQQTVNASLISAQNEFSLQTRSVGGFGTNDRYSVSYIQTVFPQVFDFKNERQKFYYLRPNPAQRSLVEIPNVPMGAALYDLTDPQSPIVIEYVAQGGTLRTVVSQTQTARTLLLTADFKKATELIPVLYKPIDPAQFDYLIVTDARLKPAANAYAAYRATAAGGGYRPFVVDYQTLRDYFNYGERSPLAIRRFVAFMHSSGKPKMLFLVGRAVSIYDTRNELASADLVPTVGYPGSDLLLTDNMAGSPENVPSVPTGRLNVTTNAQILTYLNKVKEFEQLPAATSWRKNILHLSGGKTFDEIDAFKQTLDDVGAMAQQKYVGATVRAVGKVTTNAVEKANVAPFINAGVGVVAFFGHSGSTITDLDIGFASNPENSYRNKQKYPLMVFNGCGVGNVFFNNDPLTTDWLLTPDAGSVAIIAHDYFSFFQPNVHYLGKLYQTLFHDSTSSHLPIGIIYQRTAQRVATAFFDPYDVANSQQMILQGDPALRFFPFTKPDFEVSDKALTLTTRRANVLFAAADSVFLKVPVQNLGRFDPAQVFRVSLKRTLNDGKVLTTTLAGKIDTLTFKVENNLNVVLWEVKTDSDNAVDEINEKNNAAQLAVTSRELSEVSVFSRALFPDRTPPILEVSADGRRLAENDFVAARPTLGVLVIDDNPMDNLPDSAAVEVFLQRPCGQCPLEKVTAKVASIKWSNPSRNVLRVDLGLETLPTGKYQLRVRATDAAGNEANKGTYAVGFRVGAGEQLDNLRAFPNPAVGFIQFNFTPNEAQVGETAVLKIYNVAGRLVKQTVFKMQAGENRVFWLGDAGENGRAAAGVYLYDLKSENGKLAKTGQFLYAP